jgi:hypothetical protein
MRLPARAGLPPHLLPQVRNSPRTLRGAGLPSSLVRNSLSVGEMKTTGRSNQGWPTAGPGGGRPPEPRSAGHQNRNQPATGTGTGTGTSRPPGNGNRPATGTRTSPQKQGQDKQPGPGYPPENSEEQNPEGVPEPAEAVPGTGNREPGTGNREPGTGNREPADRQATGTGRPPEPEAAGHRNRGPERQGDRSRQPGSGSHKLPGALRDTARITPTRTARTPTRTAPQPQPARRTRTVRTRGSFACTAALPREHSRPGSRHGGRGSIGDQIMQPAGLPVYAANYLCARPGPVVFAAPNQRGQ